MSPVRVISNPSGDLEPKWSTLLLVMGFQRKKKVKPLFPQQQTDLAFMQTDNAACTEQVWAGSAPQGSQVLCVRNAPRPAPSQQLRRFSKDRTSVLHGQGAASLRTEQAAGCSKSHLYQESCSKNNADLYSVDLYKILGSGGLKRESLEESTHGWCLPPEFFKLDKPN